MKEKFAGKVSDELELGDVSCIVHDKILELYPPKTTKLLQLVSLDERKLSCKNILSAIDKIAVEI
jgi:hypothetical protein